MAEEQDNPTARRLRLRRTRAAGGGGFSSGSLTHSESLRTSAEDDEVDDLIDPEAVSNRVQARAAQPVPQTPAPADPRRRLADVAQSGSRAYAKEYRLQLLHRLLLRRQPLDQIAQQLGVSISTVEKDRVELKKMLREQARELNIDEMVGNQTALYDEISAQALRLASDAGRVDPRTGQVIGGVPVPMRLAAMRTTLAANADKTRFYQNAGVFDALRFRRAEDGSGQSDVALLMERTAQMLQQLGSGGGFPEFSASDPNDPEILDL